MGRKQNEMVWNCYSKLNKGVECNFCKKRYMVGNVNKMEAHLLACLQSPSEIRKTIREMKAKQTFEDEHSERSHSGSSEIDTSNSSQLQLNQSFEASTPTTSTHTKNLYGFFDKITPIENVSFIIHSFHLLTLSTCSSETSSSIYIAFSIIGRIARTNGKSHICYWNTAESF